VRVRFRIWVKFSVMASVSVRLRLRVSFMGSGLRVSCSPRFSFVIRPDANQK
jgi:hypothetical protein